MLYKRCLQGWPSGKIFTFVHCQLLQVEKHVFHRVRTYSKCVELGVHYVKSHIFPKGCDVVAGWGSNEQ